MRRRLTDDQRAVLNVLRFETPMFAHEAAARAGLEDDDRAKAVLKQLQAKGLVSNGEWPKEQWLLTNGARRFL